METTALSKAQQNAIAVSYEVAGTIVNLDLDFIKANLVRGDANIITTQEAIFFMHTCKENKVNPLVSGEAYLVKYSASTPAQMVIGKAAYMRRAAENPNYIGKTDGIVVQRGNDIIRKEGCCKYPNEILIGGWCRVRYRNNGEVCEAFREVSLAEYNSNQANWKSKPATMINKVAIAQCLREAFPTDYEGLYSEDEMAASGAVPSKFVDTSPDKSETESVIEAEGEVVYNGDDDIISGEQRLAMFKFAEEHFGPDIKPIFDELQSKYGYEHTTKITVGQYKSIMRELAERAESIA